MNNTELHTIGMGDLHADLYTTKFGFNFGWNFLPFVFGGSSKTAEN